MNLESIKKSLAKIPAWVKKNPKQAGVVAVVIVVIAYFAIKRGAQDSGETTAAPGEESLDSLGGGLGASELTSGGGGSSIIPGAETPASSTTTTTTTESGGGFDGGGFAESDFTSSFANVPSGFVNTAPAFSGSSAAIVADPVAAFRPASEMSGLKSVVTSAGIANKPAIIRPTATPVMAPKVNNTVRAAVKTPVIVTKTDAEKAGLSKYYTGVSGGRRYVAGVYVGTAAPAPVKSGKSVKKV